MHPSRALTVEQKLTWMILVTSAVALLTGSVVVFGHDLMHFRLVLTDQLAVLASTTGRSSAAALAVQDAHAVIEVLQPLRSAPHVIAACIYDKTGQPFAHYKRDSDLSGPCPAIRPEGSYFGDSFLAYFGPVVFRGETIGTVYLASDMGQVRARAHRTLIAILLALFGCLTLAFAVASHLQKLISEPLQELSCTARQIALERNYAVRAGGGYRKDEFGMLIRNFNDMLQQIHAQDLELKRQREDLEADHARSATELRQALDSVRQLQALLPICGYCKRIRTDQNYWEELEIYVSQHTEVGFSQGICPNCYQSVRKAQLEAAAADKPV